MEDWRMEDGGWKMEEINKYLVNRCQPSALSPSYVVNVSTRNPV